MSPIYTFPSILLILLQLAFSQYTEFRAQNPPIQSMHTNEDGILLADSLNIISLDSSLQIINQKNITGTLEIVSMLRYSSFLATYDRFGNVNIYNKDTLEHIRNLTSLINPPLAEPINLIGPQTSDSSIALYIAQSVPIGSENVDRHPEIDLFSYGNEFSEELSEPVRFREFSRVNREFVKVFERNGFIYFLVNQQNNYVTVREVRIVRLCSNDTFYRGDFTTKYELILSCLPNENSALYATHAQLINDRIIIAHSTGDSSSICVFNLTEIDLLMNEKYYRCVRGEAGEKAGFERIRQVPCQKLEIIGGVCSLGGYLRNGLEVSTALTANSIYSKLEGDWIRGLTAVYRNGLEIVFIGIKTGEVYKMLLKSDSIEKIHTYRISPDIPKVLQLDETNDAVNVQSNNKIYKLPLESCDTLKGCEMCLSTQDPTCGWCTILNSCTLQSECYWDSKALPWMSTVNNNNSNCSSIKLIDAPDSISVDDSVENVELEGLFLPTRSTPYICDFATLGMSNLIQKDTNIFVCPLPTDYKKKVITYSIDIVVALRDTETNLVFLSVNRPIQFYNCTKIDRCIDCTNATRNSFSCSWCVQSTTCIDSSKLTCDSTDTTATDGSCPILFNNALPDLIHSDVPTDVVLTGVNLPEPKDSSLGYECLYSGSTVKARFVNSSQIICTNISLPIPPSSLIELRSTIRVRWNEKYLIESVGVISITSYYCGNLADDCSQCESLQFNQELSHYKCGWCNPLDTCHFTPFCEATFSQEMGICPDAKLISITPNEGPNLGGTVVTIRGSNLGIQWSDILSITIGESTCDIINNKYEPGKVVVCRTRGNLIDTFDVKLTIRGKQQRVQGLKYTYSEPKVFKLEPTLGPISGGTTVTFTGEKLLIGSQTSVQIGTKICDIQTQISNNTELVCITRSIASGHMTTVLLKIDDLMISLSQGRNGEENELLKFTYLPDPTVTKVTPSSMFPSGGLDLLIHGTNFNAIQRASMLITYNNNNNNNNNRRRRRREITTITNCEVLNESILSCPTPELTTGTNSSTGKELSLDLKLDSVPIIQGLDSIEFLLQPDPQFYKFENNLTQSPSQPILIQGKNFLMNGLEPRHFKIVAGDRECETRHVQEGLVVCYLTSTEYTTEPLFVEAQIGNIITNIGFLKLTQESQLWKLILPIIVISLCSLFAIIIGICLLIFRSHSRKKDVKLYRLVKNLEQLEMGVAQESKKGFTELQTCVEEFDQDITGTKLPFLELRIYLIRILFPEGNDAILRHKTGSNRFIHTTKILPSFKELILNEEFLIQFIAVLEKQTSFVVKDKCNVASLLTVILLTEMDYSTHILKLLLAQLIDKSVVRQQTKLLLRRTDSVAEKLLTNWLAICLHGYIKDQIGIPLYKLSRALKMQLEKGPIDVVTGEARYSLSEEKMLRQVIQEDKLNCFLDTGEGNGMPITFLDWDSVGQAKEKALDALYKSRPVSERPSLIEVDLEYTRNRFSVAAVVLRDLDSSSESERGWTRVNTLKHYKIESGAHFKLKARYEPSKCDYVGTIIASFDKENEQNLDNHLWHLSKPDDAESNSSSGKEKMASEVYLHRLLYSKNVLQKFVNDLFESIFAVNEVTKDGYPLAIRYFFGFLEDQATKHDITDCEVIQAWKNNSLALRFWVNVIKNPEFVFSIHKSSTMDSCLLVVAQTFMDSFSVSNTKLNKDSPTSKLLYAKEVKIYKQSVSNYYEDIKKLSRVTEDQMTEEMNLLSKNLEKADMLDTDEALYQLFRYANKYSKQLYDNLTENGYNSLAAHFQDTLYQLSPERTNNQQLPQSTL